MLELIVCGDESVIILADVSRGDTMLGTLATLHFGAAFKLSSMYLAERTNFLEMSDDWLVDPLMIKGGR